MSSSREPQRLGEIIENAEAALGYIDSRPLDLFEADRKSVDAAERCLERIIEACIKIGSDRMEEIAPDLPFHALRQMGNLLRHAYDGVDRAIIYNTIVDRLPDLIHAARTELGRQRA